jgi:hypothetical protein
MVLDPGRHRSPVQRFKAAGQRTFAAGERSPPVSGIGRSNRMPGTRPIREMRRAGTEAGRPRGVPSPQGAKGGFRYFWRSRLCRAVGFSPPLDQRERQCFTCRKKLWGKRTARSNDHRHKRSSPPRRATRAGRCASRGPGVPLCRWRSRHTNPPEPPAGGSPSRVVPVEGLAAGGSLVPGRGRSLSSGSHGPD